MAAGRALNDGNDGDGRHYETRSLEETSGEADVSAPESQEREPIARLDEAGAFEPVEVQPDGGRSMPFAAWLRGIR